MRLVLLLLLYTAPAAAVTLSFDEVAASNANAGGLEDQYADDGVRFHTADDGSVWDGRSKGDPGVWGLEGRNGSAFLGFNGASYDLAATFDAPVRALRLDVSSSLGAEEGAFFTVLGYRQGVLVDSETVQLGRVNEWVTAGLDAEVDLVQWRGDDDRFHPFGVDNLRWIPADIEPASVAVEVRPGTRTPLDPQAGGVVGAIVYGNEDFQVEEVDETTLAIGPDGAGIAHGATLHFKDVDEDGWLDLVALYRLDETGIGTTDPEVCLTGETFSGEPFEGCTGLLVAAVE